MRKFKFLPHLLENEPPEALPTDGEPEGRGMDPRLPIIGAAIFAAVVAAGGWSLSGNSVGPSSDVSAVQLTADSTAVPTASRVADVAAATPTPSSVVPVRGREREREDSRGPGAGQTPVPGSRERDDD